MALAVIALARDREMRSEREVLAGVAAPSSAPVATSDHAQLTLRTEHAAGGSTITLWGELDIASAAVLEAEVIVAEQLGATSITIDLSGLDFIDTSGLQAIMDAHGRCARHGRELTLLRGPAQVQRIFDLTRTRGSLAFLD